MLTNFIKLTNVKLLLEPFLLRSFLQKSVQVKVQVLWKNIEFKYFTNTNS